MGLDERWLHERIEEDPLILGLGDLHVMEHERKQATGGRIDFLMREPETDMMYEIEIMLGRLDESYIIRTIEYWDVERRRWPSRDHSAVIVAEDITNRFFNVISLFNRSIPIIAIQLNALRVEDKIVLDFTRVLDIFEPPEEEEGERVDSEWWKDRANSDSLAVVERCIALLSEDGKKPRITYNKGEVAIGGVRRNFCWLHPLKIKPYCAIDLRCDELRISDMTDRLEQAGIHLRKGARNIISFNISQADLNDHEHETQEVLREAYRAVGGGPA